MNITKNELCAKKTKVNGIYFIQVVNFTIFCNGDIFLEPPLIWRLNLNKIKLEEQNWAEFPFTSFLQTITNFLYRVVILVGSGFFLTLKLFLHEGILYAVDFLDHHNTHRRFK